MIASPTLLFRVGETMYGCDVADAQEIVPLRRMTRLPGAPACVRGLINMRGTIVTVLDLGVRVDPQRAPAREGSILLVRHGERLVGVVVDEVLDVRGLDIEAGDAATAGGALVRGVASVDGGAVVILDLGALITQVLLS
ncbi:MAG: chemotaxis protein CheW [Gemmatimonadetes bacterium]|nr:chemotaxis protein CheW [Gemmatimonadota bacterium]